MRIEFHHTNATSTPVKGCRRLDTFEGTTTIPMKNDDGEYDGVMLLAIPRSSGKGDKYMITSARLSVKELRAMVATARDKGIDI